MLFIETILICISLYLLYAGANILIQGSAACALWFGISELVIGLTVVAYLTSAPELFVSVFAAYEGNSGVAIGNVVGSNIFNILVILGLSALMQPLEAKRSLVQFDMPIMIVLSSVLGLLLFTGEINRLSACMLLMGIILYTVYHISKKDQEVIADSAVRKKPIKQALVYIFAGLGIVIVGSKILLSSSIAIAKAFSIPDEIIAVTLIAAGTSLPELAVSIVAAYKKHHDISIGNIVGSNIFNIASVIGLSGLIAPLNTRHIQAMLWRDVVIMAIVSVWLYGIIRFVGRITRLQGLIFVSSYIFYVLYLLLIV